jgi:hypothetical protein
MKGLTSYKLRLRVCELWCAEVGSVVLSRDGIRDFYHKAEHWRRKIRPTRCPRIDFLLLPGLFYGLYYLLWANVRGACLTRSGRYAMIVTQIDACSLLGEA